MDGCVCVACQASEDALVARPTDPLLAAREEATDAQIDALRQGLPHLTDPASLHDQSFGKQPQGIDLHAEQGKRDHEQKKRTRTTRQATQTQPLLLAADAFVAALGAVPAEDWCRTWAAGRTIMLTRTSNRVKEVVDKMRLPAVVRLSRSFWDDARLSRSFWDDARRNRAEEAKLQVVLRQLVAMPARWHITTLELPECEMKGPDAERLAGVLAQCPALAHLDLSGNSGFGAAGAEFLARVLGQCRELVHVNLSRNHIGAGGAERLAGVLAQCPVLAHLDLSWNQIGNVQHNQLGYNNIEVGSLAEVLGQCAALAHLDLRGNEIGARGTDSLARVLPQCTALAHLNLSWNMIGAGGANSLAGVLGQCAALTHLNLSDNRIEAAGAESVAGVLGHCTALTHLDLSYNWIGNAGAESVAGVLAQCPALAHLDVRLNDIGTVGEGRLRASWRGQAPGLCL
jgi:Ran GTPase-activating protein (RanGAP) involved in mRNA processing and transport